MLFNSYEFIFLFLPITLAGFFWIGRFGQEAAIGWLVVASLFFYGWWNPVYLWLILGLTLANFAIGRQLGHAYTQHRRSIGRFWLILGVGGNLAVLIWFKYANFAVNTINALSGTQLFIETIVLPLGISFFTFQKIAYLVDAYRGITREYKLAHFMLFVTFFPQLIAGPIVHHGEIMPQFMARRTLRPRLDHLSIGITIFAIGLFKKAVLADGIAPYATPVFDAAAHGEVLTFFQAWGGALAYTFQLYFDFSGYSDMAIGAARLFGIRLPLNFHSPYKATSIVEFWRRWHMTLSRFLRDYLYIPLGGNRSGSIARYRNLMVTMLLGGLWHGAGWNFILWGALHGAYLAINHAWGIAIQRIKGSRDQGILPHGLSRLLAWALTFLAVIVGWVFFRSADVHTVVIMLRGMAGLEGIALPNAVAVRLGDLWTLLSQWGCQTYLGGGDTFMMTWIWIAGLLPLTLFAPNTQQIMARAKPALTAYSGGTDHEISLLPRLPQGWAWQPSIGWALAAGIAAALGVLALTQISEFLYFQF
jgi:D-alanyl-lipoteichoic acid acyltransferase DltB (MBOAT superfamily)